MTKTKEQEIREHWQRFRRQVEETGDLLRGRRMPELTEELFSLYEKTGNRLLYENEYFERRRFLAVFGLLSIWYGRTEDIRKLEEVIGEICKEETWALPAHVNRKEADWQRTVDLFASETGQTLAQIIFLLKGKLDGELAEQARKLVIYRLLDSYMEKERGAWRWEAMANNWVAVCAGSLGSMALYLLEDEPERQKQIIERVLDTLPDYLSGMCEDGACPEGLSYFTYGMVYYTGFARQLEEYSKGAVRLMEQEKVRRIARFQQACYLTEGVTVSFSDGNSRDRYRLGLTCYLAGAVEGVELPPLSAAMDFEDDHCYRFMGNYQDDRWVCEYLEKCGQKSETENSRCVESGGRTEVSRPGAEETEQCFTLLPDAQWAVWKKKEAGMALKGGHNGEPHNHNDVGSFLFAAKGEVFLSDLGCGEYTREYFADSTRYTLLCNRSLGHNVPLLNGREQKCGQDFGASYFMEKAPGCVSLEFGGAYGSSKRLVRTLDFSKEEEFLLEDMLTEMEEQDFLEENFVTQAETSAEGNIVVLKGQKGILVLEAEGAGEITLHKEIFRSHRGRDEDVLLIRFRVHAENGRALCRVRGRYTALGI